jgi:cell division septation protein DedD
MRATEIKLRNMPDHPVRSKAAPVVTAEAKEAEPTEARARQKALTVTSSEANGRSYAVQLVALRSEAEIDEAWDSLRHRYDRLGSVERLPAATLDIKGRGRFYRLLVGPFQARADANALCTGLKRDGGDCRVIIRN